MNTPNTPFVKSKSIQYPLVNKQVNAFNTAAKELYGMLNQEVRLDLLSGATMISDIFSVTELFATRNWLTENQNNEVKMLLMTAHSNKEFSKRVDNISKSLISKAERENADHETRTKHYAEMEAIKQSLMPQAIAVATEQCENATYTIEFKKGIVGSASPFYHSRPTEYYYYADVIFSTGITIYVSMKNEADELSKEEIEKAKAEHIAQFTSTYAALANPNFLYTRYKGSYCTIYGKDNCSPTGIHSLGGASSMEVLSFIGKLLKKRVDIFSPTEMLSNAAIGR